ncbi:hypothetical protein ILUMI_26725 [Ignelater luminosus]|uniref:Isoaspartyl peptidase/L-asparaginase GA20639 n=1 Tax=Ignelater luminosus TaxID=2038154 RepID=A0A8K0C9A3_IGNLU|nr:hypothetical protein ILUMI_26725 [Ignelater luminosus]
MLITSFYVIIFYLPLLLRLSNCNMLPVILVHGGAGDIMDSRVPAKIAGVKAAVKAGYAAFEKGGTVVDAVEAAVRIMEDDPAFNAGYGSVVNLEGEVEMDASIMIGSNLSAGAVTVVQDIANAISLARLVMEKTPHVLLAAHGAKKFAIDQGIPILPPGSLVTDTALEALENYKKYGTQLTEIAAVKNKGEVGTVGAVAVDAEGHVAAATSTGGITGKMVGRSSDTSVLGSGSYADDQFGAVSTTGHGETIMKFCVAHTIIKAMENGKSADQATIDTINAMTAKLNNTAGAITVSKTGEIGIAFSSKRMAWAYRQGNEVHYGIERGQHEKEPAE